MSVAFDSGVEAHEPLIRNAKPVANRAARHRCRKMTTNPPFKANPEMSVMGRKRTFPEYSRKSPATPLVSTSGVFSGYRNWCSTRLEGAPEGFHVGFCINVLTLRRGSMGRSREFKRLGLSAVGPGCGVRTSRRSWHPRWSPSCWFLRYLFGITDMLVLKPLGIGSSDQGIR